MDYFGRDDLTELLEHEEGPAVSIYLGTERTSAGAEANRLRFRSAMEEARGRLAEELDDSAVDDLTGPLAALTEDEEFWRYQAGGFAAFAGDGLSRVYRLPTGFDRLVVVGPTFHTRPLVEYLQAPDRFWVLGLSQKQVRLWEGTLDRLIPLDLAGAGIPGSLQEALGYEFERDQAGFTSSRRRAGFSGGRSPVFHGHGVGQDDSEATLKRFFKQVDDGVRELLADEIGPLVLAAVDYYHPLYREVSGLDNLAEGGVEGNVTDWDLDRLHGEAWPIARETVLEKLDAARELWESAYHSGKGETDLASAAHLAVAGRIRLLLTERDRTFWGRMDREIGKVELIREGGDDPGPDAVDLLDEVAEVVMRHGGRALVLPADRMPTDTGVAAILW